MSILLNKMDDIELDNLGNRPVEEEEKGEEETNTDWRDESVVIIGGSNLPLLNWGKDLTKKKMPTVN